MSVAARVPNLDRSQTSRLTGAILAAGQSRRMGRPKALLPVDPSAHRPVSFVRSVIHALREGGIDRVIVVARPADAGLATAVAEVDPAIPIVVNPRAEEGQLSSVVAAVGGARPDDAGVLVTLVDLPLIRPSTIAALVAGFSARPTSIVRAVHKGRHGHPVIFPARVFDALRRADPSVGARAVVRAPGQELIDCEVDDPGILVDIDTPEDYARLVDPKP
jgi:molybdenum cofactor cytidylyltransferase